MYEYRALICSDKRMFDIIHCIMLFEFNEALWMNSTSCCSPVFSYIGQSNVKKQCQRTILDAFYNIMPDTTSPTLMRLSGVDYLGARTKLLRQESTCKQHSPRSDCSMSSLIMACLFCLFASKNYMLIATIDLFQFIDWKMSFYRFSTLKS